MCFGALLTMFLISVGFLRISIEFPQVFDINFLFDFYKIVLFPHSLLFYRFSPYLDCLFLKEVCFFIFSPLKIVPSFFLQVCQLQPAQE